MEIKLTLSRLNQDENLEEHYKQRNLPLEQITVQNREIYLWSRLRFRSSTISFSFTRLKSGEKIYREVPSKTKLNNDEIKLFTNLILQES